MVDNYIRYFALYLFKNVSITESFMEIERNNANKAAERLWEHCSGSLRYSKGSPINFND